MRVARWCLLLVALSPLGAVELGADGWRLWCDSRAAWRDDPLYLPGECDLATLPANPPTGGWQVLDDQLGRAVTLPATVEQHLWGQWGLRTPDPLEPARRLGDYRGVSWWWRRFDSHGPAPGQLLVLRVRGARLRCEVYVNGVLCGYSLLPGVPFEVDVTGVVKVDQPNLLALRVTSPGGSFDRGDATVDWGGRRLAAGRGWCGLDGGVELVERARLEVTDLSVEPTAEPRTVRLRAAVTSHGPGFEGPVSLLVSRDTRTVWQGRAPLAVKPGQTKAVAVDVQVPQAELWEPEHPVLYRAAAMIPGLPASERGVDFGFRWFGRQGERLTLNGQPLRLYAARSAGYWGGNGLFPEVALAEREVRAAHALGLNALLADAGDTAALALDAADRLGLVRCRPLVAVPAEATDFGARFARALADALARRDQSHPCVLVTTAGSGPDWAVAEPGPGSPAVDEGVSGWDALEQRRLGNGYGEFLSRGGFGSSADLFRTLGELGFRRRSPWDARGRAARCGVLLGEWEAGGWPTQPALVDARRVPLGPAGVVAATLAREALVLRPGQPSVSPGERTTVRLEVYSDAGRSGPHICELTVLNARGKSLLARREELRVSPAQPLLLEASFVAEGEGPLTLTARLAPIEGRGTPLTATASVAVIGERAVPPAGASVLEVTGAGQLTPGGLGEAVLTVPPGELTRYTGLAAGPCDVELTFRAAGPGAPFDVLLNGQVALAAVDVFHEVGAGRPLTRKAACALPDGVLTLGLAGGAAPLAQVKLTDARGRVVAEYPGRLPRTDAEGQVWQPLLPRPSALARSVAEALLAVRRDGQRLVVCPRDPLGAAMAAQALAEAGVWECAGQVGPSAMSWLFARPHWLTDGLPADALVATSACSGLQLSGRELEVVAGYGCDHQPSPGVALAVAKYGAGEVVWLNTPGAGSPAVQRRLLRNALAGRVE